MLRLLLILEVLNTCIANTVNIDVATPQNDRQQSANDLGCCILNNPRATLQLSPLIEVLATFIGNMINVDITTPESECQQSVNSTSTEHQQRVNRASTI
jgi:hypothetical protein